MSNDRMMATTYRFEINKGKTNTGQMQELARIQQHEQENQDLLMKKKISLEGFRTDWNNQFDAQNAVYRNRISQKDNYDQLKILRRANLIARRDALKQLLLSETRMLEADLNSVGLTLRKERL